MIQYGLLLLTLKDHLQQVFFSRYSSSPEKLQSLLLEVNDVFPVDDNLTINGQSLRDRLDRIIVDLKKSKQAGAGTSEPVEGEGIKNISDEILSFIDVVENMYRLGNSLANNAFGRSLLENAGVSSKAIQSLQKSSFMNLLNALRGGTSSQGNVGGVDVPKVRRFLLKLLNCRDKKGGKIVTINAHGQMELTDDDNELEKLAKAKPNPTPAEQKKEGEVLREDVEDEV